MLHYNLDFFIVAMTPSAHLTLTNGLKGTKLANRTLAPLHSHLWTIGGVQEWR
jgi:hypothetical protein